MSTPAGFNAFTLIRWFFAVSLVVFHGSVAAGCEYVWFVPPHAIISVFFVMSGMLTYESCLIRPGTKAFYLRRIRKIIPPYFIVVVAAAVAGIFLSVLDVPAYLSCSGTYKYLAANLTFLNFLAPELPGVFSSNIVTAVNSSLWTMKVEVAFYALLPACMWAVRRFKPVHVITVLYLLSVAWNILFGVLFQSTGNGIFDMLRRQVFGQMMYFAAGMAAFHLRPAIMRHRFVVFVAGMAVWAACTCHAALRPAEPVAIAAVLTVAAYGSKRLACISVRIPNLTYEVYLLHFPVIQVLVSAGFFAAAGFLLAFAVAAVVVLFLAVLLRRLSDFAATALPKG